MLKYDYMQPETNPNHTRDFSDFINYTRERIALIASTAVMLCTSSSAEALQADKSQPGPEKTTFIAGKGMTKAFITEIRRSVSESFLPIPKGQFVVTLGQTGKFCADAKKKNRPNIAACIDTEQNIIHYSKGIQPWQIARYTAHEFSGGHEAIDKIWRKEKRTSPRKASKFLIGLFMTSGMAKNSAEARNIIRRGPLTQNMSSDMREIYADEAAAEIAGHCGQAGFVLHESTSFVSRLSDDAKVEVPAPEYNATCHYLYSEYSKHPDIFTSAGEVAPDEPMGINYYENIFCSVRTGNSAWPQWQRACRDSD